jgi:hypothetical protein
MIVNKIVIEGDVASLYQDETLLYTVTKDGKHIIDCRKNQELPQTPDGTHQNYLRISQDITINGVNYRRTHSIVYRCFSGGELNDQEIHHIDMDEHNNDFSNLIPVEKEVHKAYDRISDRHLKLKSGQPIDGRELTEFFTSSKYSSFKGTDTLFTSEDSNMYTKNSLLELVDREPSTRLKLFFDEDIMENFKTGKDGQLFTRVEIL